jgi:hypothetical protein
MLGNGKMIDSMERAGLFMRMESTTKVTSLMTKHMERESITTMMGLSIEEIFKATGLMGMEWRLTRMAQDSRVDLSKDRSRKENSYGQTGLNTLEILPTM